MPVINFNGADKVILGSEADKAYLGNELVWKIKNGLPGVYSRDEVNLEGLNRVEMEGGSFDPSGYFNVYFRSKTPIKYIEVNNQFIEVLDGEELEGEDYKTIEFRRFNKEQAEKLLGITLDRYDYLDDLVDIYGWRLE